MQMRTQTEARFYSKLEALKAAKQLVQLLESQVKDGRIKLLGLSTEVGGKAIAFTPDDYFAFALHGLKDAIDEARPANAAAGAESREEPGGKLRALIPRQPDQNEDGINLTLTMAEVRSGEFMDELEGADVIFGFEETHSHRVLFYGKTFLKANLESHKHAKGFVVLLRYNQSTDLGPICQLIEKVKGSCDYGK